ncbi:unnamed protein product [Rhizopus stolonifer]
MDNSNNLVNLDKLDDWLENDLHESGLLSIPMDTCPQMISPTEMVSPPISECTPRLSHLVEAPNMLQYQPLTPMDTPKTEMSPRTSPSDIQSFIKALALLGSVHPNQDPQEKNENNKRERSESFDKSLSHEELIALKRQRNTDAARRSRQRKAMRMETLERKVMDLESVNERLKLRAAIAESEKANIEAKEKSSKVRILELERQLANAHRVLLQSNFREITA